MAPDVIWNGAKTCHAADADRQKESSIILPQETNCQRMQGPVEQSGSDMKAPNITLCFQPSQNCLIVESDLSDHLEGRSVSQSDIIHLRVERFRRG